MERALESQSRIPYFDFVRGLAIIMVVGIHTFIPQCIDTIGGLTSALTRQILNCAVPIFLALSGYFMGAKILKSRDDLFYFWRKQIPKVYIPALIWSIPYFVMDIFGGGILSAKKLILFIVCGYSIYYFIALIIQYYILLPVLQKHKSFMLAISGAISMISITLITYISQIKGVNLPLIVYAGPFTTWFVFFMLGVYYSIMPRNYSLVWPIILTTAGFILEGFETYYLNINYGGGYGIKLSAFIYSVGIIMLMLSTKISAPYKSNKVTSVIEYIGRISFGIYLSHCYVISAFKHICPSFPWWFIWMLIIVVTSLTIVVSHKILPKRINKYLGFL